MKLDSVESLESIHSCAFSLEWAVLLWSASLIYTIRANMTIKAALKTLQHGTGLQMSHHLLQTKQAGCTEPFCDRS